MEEKTYTLHEYDHRFDAGLAQMWNESDDQWPGTFTDGVDFTAETIAEWMDRIEAIIRFIVVEDQTGKVVGYGDLWDTAVRPKSCYVALLNVHPEHQGKSLARRMLVEMVEWAVANGYDRMTIGTWPANLKAMPLYKKVGFFWKPDTTVHMESYLPAARQLPAAAAYFAEHDWYTTYDRALAQVEDDMTHPGTGETKVYVLSWQANGHQLETVFDRNAQALTGIETDAWAVFARTGEAEPAQGKAYPFEWELRNKGDHPIRVLAEARPDEGIRIAFEEAVELAPGECRLMGTTFQVDLDAPKYNGDHEDVPTPRIRTLLEIDGQPLELGTGLRYRPAVEIGLHPEIVSLVPGRPAHVHVQLRNRTKESLQGTLRLSASDGLAITGLAPAFTVGPEGFAGFPVTLLTKASGFYTLEAAAEIVDGENRFMTKPKTLPLAAFAPGGWTAGQVDDALVLENDFFRITAKRQGGEAVIWNKDASVEDARFMEEIGPAFVPWDLNEREYDLALETAGDSATAILTVRSGRFPGLVVGREITVNASPLIRVTGWVRNETEASYPALQLRPHVRVWSENRRTVAVPVTDRIVHEHGSQFGIAEEDFPKRPEGYGEGWTAYEYLGRVFGMIWADEGMEQIGADFGRFFFLQGCPLGPQETRRLALLTLYSGPGDYRSVQRAWQRIHREGADPSTRSDPMAVQAGSYLELKLEADPLVAAGPETSARLKLTSPRKYTLTGKIDLVAPEGWKIEPDSVAYEVDREHPVDVPVRLVENGQRGPAASSGEVRLVSQAFERRAGFTVIRLHEPGRPVTVEPGSEAGFETWTIDSGPSRWTIAPGFHAGVIAWRTGDSDANHLFCPFPDSGELSWLKPIFGGIRPILTDGDQHGWPGKLYAEAFSAEPVEVVDERGLEWGGVRLGTDVQAARLRGLHVTLDYLALPGSSILKSVFRIENGTPAGRDVQHGFLAFPTPDGSMRRSVLHTPDYTRQRTIIETWGIHDTWAAVENPETGRTLATVRASGSRRLLAMDLGRSGAHLYVRQPGPIAPNGSLELVSFFVLAETAGEARAFSALAELK